MANTVPYCGVPVDEVKVTIPKVKPSLYDGDNRYTETATDLSDEAYNALRPVFKKFFNQGYSPREIAHIMQAVANDLELESVL